TTARTQTASTVQTRNAALPTTTARTQTASTVQTSNAALPTTTVARAATTIAAVVKPTLTNFSIPAKTFGDAAFRLNPPKSNSPGGFRYASSRAEVATVDATTGSVTIVGVGATTITATQAAVQGFQAGTISATLIVAAAKPPIAETKNTAKTPETEPAMSDIKQPTANFDDNCPESFPKADCDLMFRTGEPPDFLALGKSKWVKMCSKLLKRSEADCETEFAGATSGGKEGGPQGDQPGQVVATQPGQ
ncbi:MAG: Ig-like domain-containing protein, partial [Actinomycetota bacterium]